MRSDASSRQITSELSSTAGHTQVSQEFLGVWKNSTLQNCVQNCNHIWRRSRKKEFKSIFKKILMDYKVPWPHLKLVCVTFNRQIATLVPSKTVTEKRLWIAQWSFSAPVSRCCILTVATFVCTSLDLNFLFFIFLCHLKLSTKELTKRKAYCQLDLFVAKTTWWVGD